MTCSFSLFVHDLFTICSLFENIFCITFSWVLCDLLLTCLQFVNDLSMTCSKIVQNLFMTFIQFFPNLFRTFSCFIPKFFKQFFTTCVCLVHDLCNICSLNFYKLFTSCSWLVQDFPLLAHDLLTISSWLGPYYFTSCLKIPHDLFNNVTLFSYITYFIFFCLNFFTFQIHKVMNLPKLSVPACLTSLLKAWPVPRGWVMSCLIFLAMWLSKTQVSGSGSSDVARVRKAQRQLHRSASITNYLKQAEAEHCHALLSLKRQPQLTSWISPCIGCWRKQD